MNGGDNHEAITNVCNMICKFNAQNDTCLQRMKILLNEKFEGMCSNLKVRQLPVKLN